jgi:hypothetical protein
MEKKGRGGGSRRRGEEVDAIRGLLYIYIYIYIYGNSSKKYGR